MTLPLALPLVLGLVAEAVAALDFFLRGGASSEEELEALELAPMVGVEVVDFFLDLAGVLGAARFLEALGALGVGAVSVRKCQAGV